MLDSIVVWLEDDLGKQFNGLRKELALERKSKLGDLSLNLDLELTSKRIHQLINFVFGVFFSAIKSSVGSKVRY